MSLFDDDPAEPRKRKRPPRLPADARTGVITGYIVRDGKKLYLMTSDRRRVLARLQVVRRYKTPRHDASVTMVLYRAEVDGETWVGRASGLVLTLRRGTKF